jgi:hypothetical protein
MNLLKAQDLLKGVPDQKLRELAINPQGDIPPFLIAAEAARRAKMRQEYKGDTEGKMPTSTVMEDLLNNLGVASLQPPGQQQVPVQAPQMPAAPQEPVQMYDGGIVSFATGGEIEDYLQPRAGGSDMGFAASVAPYIPQIDGRVRAGVIGSSMAGSPEITGYQIGYEDGKNSVLANIMPTPMGNIANAEYRRQLGDDSEIAVRGNVSPFEQVPMEARQAPVSVEYTQRFANGGIASFQRGGYTDMSAYMPEYASNIQVPDLPGFQEFLTQAQTGLGDSGLPEYRKDIEAERERIQKEAPTDLSSFLKYVGRGLASAKSPNFINAVAEGVSTGLTMQEQAELKNKEAARQLRQSEIELVQKERAEKAGLFGLAKQLEANSIDRRNSAINQNYQATQLALTGRHYEDTARNAAAKLKLDERQLGIAAANARRSEEDAKLDRQLKELQIKRMQTGELEPRDKATVLKAIATQKTNLFSALSYSDTYQKGLDDIKKKFKDPLAQQRAIQMYNQPYFEQAGISELEALLTPTPIK